MNSSTLITHIKARHIFDSRGNPTIFCKVTLADGAEGCAAVPSGASTGKYECIELRDKEKAYGGKGVFKAIYGINGLIREQLVGKDAADQEAIDRLLIALDGSEQKGTLGANALLAVSLACARASAAAFHQELYRYVGGAFACKMPIPFMNVLNGGRHADNGLDIQEYMIVPHGATSFAGAMRMGSEVYHALGALLKEDDYRTALGDEGGYAPAMKSDEEALRYLVRAIEFAGYRPGKDVSLALDAAASEWYSEGKYRLNHSGHTLKGNELIDYYESLCKEFPIISLEDPLAEDDFEGFAAITERLGKEVQIVGDDLFVTNAHRLMRGIEERCCNCVLIKPNQVGTLSETAKTIHLAKEHGYQIMLSHRSGETEDSTIADLSVAFFAGQIKSGAPARAERTAKYNRLLEIEDTLEESAQFGTIPLK